MTRPEFDECFLPLQVVYHPTLSDDRLDRMGTVYFNLVKGFDRWTWRKATLQVAEESPPKLPKPVEFQQKCYILKTPVQLDCKPLISKEEAQKPSNVAARREFYKTLHNTYKKVYADRNKYPVYPKGEIIHGLYDHLIADPYEKEMRYQEREKERKITIQKAENEEQVGKMEQEQLPF